jgi:hypothetical protein
MTHQNVCLAATAVCTCSCDVQLISRFVCMSLSQPNRPQCCHVPILLPDVTADPTSDI